VTGDYRKITDIVGTQVSAKKHYIQAKETELEAIKAEIKNSQVASSSELDTLSLQTKTLTKEKEEITAEFNKMKESLVSLEKVLSQEIAGFNTKEDGSNKLSQYLLQKKSEMETLAKDFAETKKKYKETAALVEKSHEIAGNSREMLTQKQATIDMLNAKIEAFSVEKFDLIKQIQELTKENQQIAKKNDDLSLSNSDLNRRLFQSNYSVPDESEEISTLQKRVDALEEELKLKKDSIKILEAEIVKIKTANNLLAEENKKLSNEAELKISALENKIKTLASRPVFSSEEVAALQSDNSNLKKSNASLQDEIMKYKNDQETMRTEIRALRKELESSVGLEKENTVVKSLLENIANELIHIYQGLEQSKEKLEESLKEPDPMTILDKISQLISIREIEFEKSFLNATPITFGEFQEHNTVVCLPTSRNHYFIPHRMEGINVIYVLGEEGKVTKRDPKEKYSIIVGKIKNLTVLENSFQFLNEYKITDMTTTVIAVDIEETVTIPGLG
jgi:chromosome segregation ATPase